MRTVEQAIESEVSWENNLALFRHNWPKSFYFEDITAYILFAILVQHLEQEMDLEYGAFTNGLRSLDMAVLMSRFLSLAIYSEIRPILLF